MASRKRSRRKRAAKRRKAVSSGDAKQPVEPDEQQPRVRQLSPGKLWTFRLIAATVIPLGLFLAIEVGLRVVGYGRPTRSTLVKEVSGTPCHVPNAKFGWRFFPREIARGASWFAYPTSKDKQTVRIFILGASAALGDPAPDYGFARIIEVMLRDSHPGVHFEIVNTGMAAINSHVVREIAGEVAGHDADAMICYLGNNEVVGPFGPSNAAVGFVTNKAWIRAQLFTRKMRIGQAIEDALRGSHGASDSSRRWLGMAEFLENQVPAHDARLETVYGHFRNNLNDICDAAESDGVPLLLSTVGVNLRDSAPFASLHRQDLTEADLKTWQEHYDRAQILDENGQYESAIDELRAAETIDQEFADLHYRLARLLWKLNRIDEAGAHYQQARELDALRFRADSRINQTITEVALAHAENGTILVDGENALVSHAEHGVPGRRHFYEHVHLTFAGNYVLAQAMVSKLLPVLPEWVRKHRVSRTLTQAECADRLALTEFDQTSVYEDILTRLRHPPFSGQLDIDEQRTHLQQEMQGLGDRGFTAQKGRGIYAKALQAMPNDPWLRVKYGRFLTVFAQDHLAAEEPLRAALKMGLEDPNVHLHLGDALVQQNRFEEAHQEFLTLLRFDPLDSTANYKLADLLRRQGNLQAAITFYQTAIKVEPGFSDAHNNLGSVYGQLGDSIRASQHFRSAVEADPGNATAQANLAQSLNRLGHPVQAVQHYYQAIRLNPRDFGSIEQLAWLLATCPDQAARDGRVSLRLAEQLCNVSGERPPHLLGIMAAAQAELGQFDAAVKTETEALAKVDPANDAMRRSIAGRIARYRQHRRYRELAGP